MKQGRTIMISASIGLWKEPQLDLLGAASDLLEAGKT